MSPGGGTDHTWRTSLLIKSASVYHRFFVLRKVSARIQNENGQRPYLHSEVLMSQECCFLITWMCLNKSPLKGRTPEVHRRLTRRDVFTF